MSELAAGTMVTPNVRLVRPLGEGGMGAVWVADHLALRTQVVVKFISDSLKASDEARERFSREAAAAAQVKSPHVVQTFDHGLTDEGRPYIVMELLEGKDLARHLDEVGRVSPEVALEICVQLSRALDRAHERGIIHRDIKPGNIFLCDGGNSDLFVKLLDFGIAKGVDAPKIDSNTKTGSMIGSPFYMSPEQILGSKDVDRRSDLWSVGVVAFEALTGAKPFDAETMGGLAIKIHSEPLPMPSKLVPSLPSTLDAWFQRACARNVDERFATAREMVEALAAAIGGQMPPRSTLDPQPMSSSSKSPALLPAGAATDAGVTAPASRAQTRNRALMLVATVVVLGPLSYFVLRQVTHRPDVDPKGIVSQPSITATQEKLPPTATNTVAATPSTEPAPPTSAPVVQTNPVRPGHPGGRPHPAPPPPSSTSQKLPPPPPAPSGHDIF